MMPPGEVWCYLRVRVSENSSSRKVMNRVATWLLASVPSSLRLSRRNRDNVPDRRRMNVPYLPLLIGPKMLSGAATLAGAAEQAIRRRSSGTGDSDGTSSGKRSHSRDRYRGNSGYHRGDSSRGEGGGNRGPFETSSNT